MHIKFWIHENIYIDMYISCCNVYIHGGMFKIYICEYFNDKEQQAISTECEHHEN